MFERPPFWNGCSCGFKNYGIKVIFNDMTFLLNLKKNITVGSKVDRGQTHKQTRREDGMSLAYIFHLGKKVG
jgi:hypothetical protein